MCACKWVETIKVALFNKIKKPSNCIHTSIITHTITRKFWWKLHIPMSDVLFCFFNSKSSAPFGSKQWKITLLISTLYSALAIMHAYKLLSWSIYSNNTMQILRWHYLQHMYTYIYTDKMNRLKMIIQCLICDMVSFLYISTFPWNNKSFWQGCNLC